MGEFEKFQFFDEEGRQEIYRWSELRRQKYRGFRRNIYFLRLFAFDRGLLKSFVRNINVIVIIQMVLAGGITFLCQYTGIRFEVHPTLFVSPLIFPLAFSINTDFQRREKVLEDLANFKGSAMVYFFCLRDWRESADFDENFMKAASNKLKSLLFHLREYLMTEKHSRRSFILQVIYEDCSDLAQVIERVRLSKLPANSPLVGRLVHLLTTLCYSFERLRVIREYRSPRSIRSFTKVFIFGLPILLSPYYVYLGEKNNNVWSPYFIATLVSFVFGSLQGVQDKLDDPFDGMSEDDIDLARLDDWTLQSLVATANRTFKIGRFTVLVKGEGKVEVNQPPLGVAGAAAAIQAARGSFNSGGTKSDIIRGPSFQEGSKTQQWQKRQLSQIYSDEEESLHSEDMDLHPYAGVLSKLPGNATILRGGQIKEYRSMTSMNEFDPANTSIDVKGSIGGGSGYTTPNSSIQRSVNGRKKVSFNQVVFGGDDDAQITIRDVATGTEIKPMAGSIQESSVDPPPSLKSIFSIGPPQHANSIPQIYTTSPDDGYLPDGGQTNSISNLSESSSLDNIDDEPRNFVGRGVASYINASKRNFQRQGITKNASEPELHEVHDNVARSESVPSTISEVKSRFKFGPSNQEKAKPRFFVSQMPDEASSASTSNEGSPDLGEQLSTTSSTALLVGNNVNLKELFRAPGSVPLDNRRFRRRVRSHRRSGSDSSIVLRGTSQDSIVNIPGELKDSEVFI